MELKKNKKKKNVIRNSSEKKNGGVISNDSIMNLVDDDINHSNNENEGEGFENEANLAQSKIGYDYDPRLFIYLLIIIHLLILFNFH